MLKYANNSFKKMRTIVLPNNDSIYDIKMYLNEPIILSNNGVIYKIDENFEPYIIAFNQKWLKEYVE